MILVGKCSDGTEIVVKHTKNTTDDKAATTLTTLLH